MKKAESTSSAFPSWEIIAGVIAGLILAVAIIYVGTLAEGNVNNSIPPPVSSVVETVAAPLVSDLRDEPASEELRILVNGIAASRDAGDDGFLVVDKKAAKLYVFDKSVTLLGASSVLLGSAKGDDTVPGVGERPLNLAAHERTTPAGRFVGERGHNAHGADVVWVDYDSALSMHRVLTANPKERRLERLATSTVADNRISNGCINVPAAFYEAYVRPAFRDRRSMIYILPESKSLQEVFASHLVNGVEIGKKVASANR